MADETGTADIAQDTQHTAASGLQTFAGSSAIAQAKQIVAGLGVIHRGGSMSSPGGPQPGGNASLLNLSVTTLVKGIAGKTIGGTIFTVSVTTAGSTAGALYDYNATTGYGVGNLIAPIPEAVGIHKFEFPFFIGLVYVPGTDMVASVAYS